MEFYIAERTVTLSFPFLMNVWVSCQGQMPARGMTEGRCGAQLVSYPLWCLHPLLECLVWTLDSCTCDPVSCQLMPWGAEDDGPYYSHGETQIQFGILALERFSSGWSELLEGEPMNASSLFSPNFQTKWKQTNICLTGGITESKVCWHVSWSCSSKSRAKFYAQGE